MTKKQCLPDVMWVTRELKCHRWITESIWHKDRQICCELSTATSGRCDYLKNTRWELLLFRLYINQSILDFLDFSTVVAKAIISTCTASVEELINMLIFWSELPSVIVYTPWAHGNNLNEQQQEINGLSLFWVSNLRLQTDTTLGLNQHFHLLWFFSPSS